MIAIVDYGMGNLKSVQNVLDFLKIPSTITDREDEILNAKGVILPGVGAFPDAMKYIKNKKLDEVIKKVVKANKPILGICLGMQLLFDESDEVEKTKGLGFIKGTIKKLEVDLKIPHMGWNNLKINKNSPLLKGVKEDSYVYFVHSYCAVLKNKDVLNSYCEYSVKVPAIVSSDNIYGIQFHPEKSGDVGMKILKNFGELIK